jgi:hypothetical protein
LVKKNNSIKNIVAIIVVSVIILTSTIFLVFVTDLNMSTLLPETSVTLSDYLETLTETHIIQVNTSVPFFDGYLTPNDHTRFLQYSTVLDGIRFTTNENTSELIDKLKPNPGTVVIYPTFTSAAYKDFGFYDYYAGTCDESCITDISFDVPEFLYTSSGTSAQILYLLGYEFLTDIDVDKNPNILENYDTVILLHNEYVTKKMFDAISGHSNLIFLFPNALYAEIAVNHDDNTMTLIRGHNYPQNEIKNGFDYEIETKFHHYEYDAECLDWKFIKIKNGFHLNCYPDSIIIYNLDILLKMKDL